jgi:hypothetical protein
MSTNQREQAERDYQKRFDQLCAMTPALEAEGWRPIETAPHDGTEIRIRLVHWLAAAHEPPSYDGYISSARAHWIDHNGGGFTWLGLAGKPAQWRPLAARENGTEA